MLLLPGFLPLAELAEGVADDEDAPAEAVEDLAELLAEALVEISVEDGVETGAGHPEEMAADKDAEHELGVALKSRRERYKGVYAMN